jgi:hypothetical protein
VKCPECMTPFEELLWYIPMDRSWCCSEGCGRRRYFGLYFDAERAAQDAWRETQETRGFRFSNA